MARGFGIGWDHGGCNVADPCLGVFVLFRFSKVAEFRFWLIQTVPLPKIGQDRQISDCGSTIRGLA